MLRKEGLDENTIFYNSNMKSDIRNQCVILIVCANIISGKVSLHQLYNILLGSYHVIQFLRGTIALHKQQIVFIDSEVRVNDTFVIK